MRADVPHLLIELVLTANGYQRKYISNVCSQCGASCVWGRRKGCVWSKMRSVERRKRFEGEGE